MCIYIIKAVRRVIDKWKMTHKAKDGEKKTDSKFKEIPNVMSWLMHCATITLFVLQGPLSRIKIGGKVAK